MNDPLLCCRWTRRINVKFSNAKIRSFPDLYSIPTFKFTIYEIYCSQSLCPGPPIHVLQRTRIHLKLQRTLQACPLLEDCQPRSNTTQQCLPQKSSFSADHGPRLFKSKLSRFLSWHECCYNYSDNPSDLPYPTIKSISHLHSYHYHILHNAHPTPNGSPSTNKYELPSPKHQLHSRTG